MNDREEISVYGHNKKVLTMADSEIPQLMSEQEYIAQLRSDAKVCAPKRRRIDVAKALRDERMKTIGEAMALLRREMREVPSPWICGYNSAITKLEILRAMAESDEG